jgi:histidinol-phosphatase (PHP family)
MVNINIKRDGHMHSKYCPHGTTDTFEQYIEVALKNGLEEITFTEHMPIPSDFMDNEFLKECAPTVEEIEKYFLDLKNIKEQYKDKIKINIGLEVDYIEGYEETIKKFLNKYGNIIEDSILSVHFVKDGDKYYCIDAMQYFEEFLNKVGSLEKVYDKYYETLLKAIKSDLGPYKPKRIGHPTLIRIFNKKYPVEYKNIDLLKSIVEEIRNRDYEVDLNTAGLRKEFCGEVYPSGVFLDLVRENNIRLVYGSDSHKSIDVSKDFK